MSGNYERKPGSALDRWLTAIEGSAMPEHGTEFVPRCDWCSDAIYPNTTVAFYCVNELINPEFADEEQGAFYMVRKYCGDCDRRRIKFPCGGYHELLLRGSLDEEFCLQDLSLVDYSSAREGDPWDPVEVWKTTHPEVAWDEWNEQIDLPLGPEDVVDALMLVDIDIRDIVDESGEIALTSKEYAEMMGQKRSRSEELDEMVDDPRTWDPDQ